MKKLLILSLSIAVVTFSAAQSTVEVTVKGIKGTSGSVRVGLFNTSDGFLKTPMKGEIVKVQGDIVKATFNSLPDGKYAVSIVHDENENGKLDSNMIGIPKEGFGFSNNVMGGFGPPDFEKASFIVAHEEKKLTIEMKYY